MPVKDRDVEAATLESIVRAGAKEVPGAVALLAPGRGEHLTYERLHHEVRLAADALAALGIRREDRVAVVLPNGPEMVVAFLAVSGVATCAPLNPAYRASEFAYYLDDLRANAVLVLAGDPSPVREVARDRRIPVLEIVPSPGAPPGVFHLDGAAERAPASRTPPCGDDIALILHTSGTTARPKIVPLLHRNLHASAGNVAAALGLSARDRCLNVMPLFHIHSLVAGVLAPLISGGSLVATPGYVATEFFDWLAEFEPTWYTAVPTIHRSVLARSAEHPAALARHCLRLIRSSSSPLSPDVMASLETTFGVPVIEAYG
ncbi:MAG: AMP-binding protein, partial [Minicystis sp.]